LKFTLSTLYVALLLPLYLHWSQQQIENQIDKMQEAVFNTPGVEAPVPPPVLLSGIALLSGHLWLGQRGLRLKSWQTAGSLVLGGLIGTGLFIIGTQNKK